MKMPKRGEKGFTLVELLIVLAILAVLAAVVIPNVTGMMGKGQAQSYATDDKTIQSGVMAYEIDIRAGDTPANAGHYLPVGASYPGVKVTDLASITDVRLDKANDDPDIAGNHRVQVDVGCDGGWVATGGGGAILNAAVNFDWLVEKKSDTDWDDPGPYLDKIPASAGLYNVSGNNNPDPGSYLWVCNKSGEIFGIYQVAGGEWYCGFQNTYP